MSPSSEIYKIVLHYFVHTRAQCIAWLTEELELPYDVARHKRLPDLHAPPELQDVYPLEQSPTIVDGDVTYAGGIRGYLIKKHGDGKVPSLEGQQWLDDTHLSHFAEGTMMPHLIFYRTITVMPSYVPFTIRPVANMIASSLVEAVVFPNVKKELALIDGQLQKYPGGWLANAEAPTVADFVMLSPLELVGPRTRFKTYLRASKNISNEFTLEPNISGTEEGPAVRALFSVW